MVFDNRKYRLTQLSAFIATLVITGIAFLVLHLLFMGKGVDDRAAVLASALLPIPLYSYFTRKYRRRRRYAQAEFPPEWEDFLKRKIAYYNTLSPERQAEFRREMLIFLGEKDIIGIETEVDDLVRVLVAASAVIPVFNLPDMEYDKLSEVLVYPSGFGKDFEFRQAGSRILGMVGIGHSMVLSKPDLMSGFRHYRDKKNVGIHEFVHKIDGEDGLIDGVPHLLINRSQREEWLMYMEMEKIEIQKGNSDINDYALTNDAEFFAVTSEYFFENPQVMKRKHPELYDILEKIYRQDTWKLFTRSVKEIFRASPKKTGRNDPCPCGSGKKYKYCCLQKKYK